MVKYLENKVLDGGRDPYSPRVFSSLILNSNYKYLVLLLNLSVDVYTN